VGGQVWPLVAVAAVLVAAGLVLARYARPRRTDRRYRQAMLNGFATALLGLVLLVVAVLRARR